MFPHSQLLPPPKTVDLYVRKSRVLSEGDRLREVSIREQEEIGRHWAAQVGSQVRHVWRELGSAYADRERPVFRKALAALQRGEVEALWVFRLDRLTRRGAEDVLPMLGKHRVIFYWDRYDTLDEHDRRHIIDEAERARQYSVDLSHRIHISKARQRRDGEWIGGNVPWGLLLDPKTRKVRPDYTTPTEDGRTRAQVLRWGAEQILEGRSARSVVAEQNELGIRGPSGGIWYVTTYISLITNPAIAGLQVAGRANNGKSHLVEPYRDEEGRLVSIGEGVLTPDEREQLLERLTKNITTFSTRRRIVRPTARHRKHILTGIAVCGTCGRSAPASGVQQVCASVTSAIATCPAPARITRERAEQLVIAEWLNRITALEPTDMLALIIAERWTARQQPSESEEIAAKRARIQEIETVRQRLHDAFRAGAYEDAPELFVSEMRSLSAELRELQAAIARSQAELDLGFVDDPETLADAMRDAVERGQRALVRDLLHLAINRVIIYPVRLGQPRTIGPHRLRIEWADAGESAESEGAFSAE